MSRAAAMPHFEESDFWLVRTWKQFSKTGIEKLWCYKITHIPSKKTMHIIDLREDLQTLCNVLEYIEWCRTVDADFARDIVKDFERITKTRKKLKN